MTATKKQKPTKFIGHNPTKKGEHRGPLKPLASHQLFYEKCQITHLRCLSDATAGELDMLCCSIEAAAASLLAWARYVQTLRERQARFPEIGSRPGPKKRKDASDAG